MSDRMDYASVVSISILKVRCRSLIGSLQRSTQKLEPRAPVDLPGGFGGLIEFGNHLLAMATDGVGSKLQIATAVKNWDSVGIDCMAMNVNDLLCVGAEPIALSITLQFQNQILKSTQQSALRSPRLVN